IQCCDSDGTKTEQKLDNNANHHKENFTLSRLSGWPWRAINGFHLKSGCGMSEQDKKRHEALVRQRYYRERQRAEGFT
ncbi:hypothetical protein RA277_31045, partial [Pseudomonas syringae pv. tagetis]